MEADNELRDFDKLIQSEIDNIYDQLDNSAQQLDACVYKNQTIDYGVLDLEEKNRILEGRVDRLERIFKKILPFLPDSAKLFLELDESEDSELWKNNSHQKKG